MWSKGTPGVVAFTVRASRVASFTGPLETLCQESPLPYSKFSRGTEHDEERCNLCNLCNLQRAMRLRCFLKAQDIARLARCYAKTDLVVPRTAIPSMAFDKERCYLQSAMRHTRCCATILPNKTTSSQGSSAARHRSHSELGRSQPKLAKIGPSLADVDQS